MANLASLGWVGRSALAGLWVFAVTTAGYSANSLAYVANTGPGTVSVIDVGANAVVATIPTGAGTYAVAVSSDGMRAYAANLYENSVSIIDTAARAVIGKLPTGGSPRGIAVSPDRRRVYVATVSPATVQVIDPVAMSTVASVPLPSGAHSIVVAPDGLRAFVAINSDYANVVSVLDLASNTVVGNLTVDVAPVDLALSRDGSRLLVTNNQSFTVSIIDPRIGPLGTVVGAVFAGHGVSGIAISPDGQRFYVTRYGNNGSDVQIFDTTTRAVLHTTPLGPPSGPLGGIGVSLDGTKVLAGVYNSQGSDFEVVLDAVTGAILAQIPVGNGPYSYGQFIGPSLDNVPPVISAPGSMVLEATSAAGAVGHFTVSAQDNVDGPVAATAQPASGALFPLGVTIVQVRAVDSAGNIGTTIFPVTVRDSSAPVITSLEVTPKVLWPANHKMVPVVVSARGTDAVGTVSIRIIQISSSEPVSGAGDEDQALDWFITGPLTANLRAERDGGGPGRVYTILIEAKDAAGNASVKTISVTVPHDRAGGPSGEK